MNVRLVLLATSVLVAATLASCGGVSPGQSSPAGARPTRDGLVFGEGTPLPTPFACPSGSEAEEGCQVVPGPANIFGAGLDEPPAPGAGGAGVPPPMWSVPPGSTTMRATDATGRVFPVRGGPANGPEGDLVGPTDVSSHGGISGIVHGNNSMFLTGVFLTDEPPSGEAPERLAYEGPDDFTEVAPEIGQTFLVGDGVERTFVVPSGATRLYLGFADAYQFEGAPGWYGNNGGELVVTVEFAAE